MSQTTFVNQVCQRVIEKHPQLHKVTLVVPAKRSIRFFSNAFNQHFTENKQAAFLPEIITLTDLFDRLTPLSKITPVELVFHFYKVYCELEPEPENFELFFTWAPQLLADFNEVDNYLLDVKTLYSDLRNIKEIEEWSFGEGGLSAGQQFLNEFWIKLPGYYHALKKYLNESKLGYNGMINRAIVSDLDGVFKAQPDRYYVFAGFNALTRCETQLMHYLVKEGKGELFFDGDNYYIQNTNHEAGLFARQQYRDFDGRINLVDAGSLHAGVKEINYYESNGEALQCAEVIRQLLALPKNALERTAIVLCNEQLLPVLINSMPAELLRVNVTMGWPLKFTKANDFFMALIDVNIAFSRSKTFVPRNIIDQFITASSALFGTKPVTATSITSKKELADAFVDTLLHTLLEASQQSIMHFIDAIVVFLNTELEKAHDNEIDAEIFAHYFEVFNKIKKLPAFAQHVNSWYVFKQLFSRFTRNYPLAFVGEPLAGIQVMGMLETRALDFEHVFILSANEGFLPAQVNYTGFIPYDLRAHVKLPGKTEQDAVYAYYFYRLIQRASSAHVFYNTQNELLQQAERSRYLLQVEKELVEINANVKVKATLVDSMAGMAAANFTVDKSEFYFKRLRELMQNGFSATMLSTYAKCRLDFYNKYILGFRSIKDYEEIDESDIGNIVHAFFQQVFFGYESKKLDAAFFENALFEMQHILGNVITEKFKSYNFLSGQNFLALELVRKMIASFLQKQVQEETHSLIGKTIVGAEIKLDCGRTVSGHQFKLMGNIDLLLRDDGDHYFVYDFKTGRVTEDGLKFTEKSKLTIDNFGQRDKLLQLLVYKMLVEQNYKTQSVQPFIIPLATGSTVFLPIETGLRSTQQLMDEFFEMVINELFDNEILLEHNEKNRFCEFCL